MSHRAHPKAYRLSGVKDWASKWQVRKSLSMYLEEDFLIRDFLEKKLFDCGVDSINVEKSRDKINVIINSSRPGLIIGRGGKGVEELKQEIEKRISKISRVKKVLPAKRFKNAKESRKRESLESNGTSKKVKIEIKEIRDPWSRSNLVAQWIAQQIEKRLPYRKALKQGLEKAIMSKEVKGARVKASGRLDGKEIARKEWLGKGSLPRQTIRAEIDYGAARARCTYGTVGIKVWIYKGEKFDV